jgi:hypothetical protein
VIGFFNKNKIKFNKLMSESSNIIRLAIHLRAQISVWRKESIEKHKTNLLHYTKSERSVTLTVAKVERGRRCV